MSERTALAQHMWRQYRRKLPAPIDVPNLVTYRDEARYRQYALLVSPALRLARGRPLWAGKPVRGLLGASPPDHFFVVRYPSHRHFVRMVVTPYYVTVCNPVREQGVADFEASWTHPEVDRLAQRRPAFLLMVHVHADDEDAPLPDGELVYRSRRVQNIAPAGARLRPADPHPLAHDLLVGLAYDDQASADAALSPAALDRLRTAAPQARVILYARTPLRELLPAGPWRALVGRG